LYIENISHSLCSLEFKPHRKLYDWFLDQIDDNTIIRPKQREFARLNLSYTIMSKRKLLRLVNDGLVKSWDDPRMPTISGLRRRGYTPTSIRKFVKTVGVAKRENVIDVSLLEFCIREDLNKTAPRVMAVLDPVKLVISNYPEGKVEFLEAENNPEDATAGSRKVPFSKELYIEKEDFKEEAGRKYFRLTLGKEVRLKNGYIIKGESVVKDTNGNITEIHSEIRVYDRLFNDEAPDSHKEKDFMEFLNPASLKVITGYVEPSLKEAKPLEQFQFQRLGYFNIDPDSTANALVFNKTVGLRDTWAKVKPKANQQNNQGKPNQHAQREVLPIDEIKRAGKKYTNLPEEKRELLKIKIIEAAKNVDLEELVPLYGTAAKKRGTRIVTTIALGVVLETKGIQPDQLAKDFIKKGKEDTNELLQKEATTLADKFAI